MRQPGKIGGRERPVKMFLLVRQVPPQSSSQYLSVRQMEREVAWFPLARKILYFV